jgi:eukaryotic-like serine/threonine-protein kinase
MTAASGIDDEHLDENALARHVAGEGTDAERVRVTAHIDGCEGCRELLISLVRTVVAPDAPDRSRRTLPRGTNLGRYVLLDPVGHGGMGVVYGAFDPELDRKVAIKFLRGREGNPAQARAQLLAEAQAIARLSHPNIVTVHDVGTFEGEVFFAMEYVKGETLRRAQQPGLAGLRHTLALYGAAGQGLAAAHRAGIVHGDFKPENVLVGEDGRVRVTDFGLARATHEHAPRFAGTPAYMAPEHWRGEAADVRSDQYSFCLALLEAVDGRRPEEVEDASPARPPEPISFRRRTLPIRLARVLARGLAAAPEQRWPSMDALLAALRGASLPFRGSTGAFAAALTVVTGVVWVQHTVWERRVDNELAASAARLPALLQAQSERVDLLVQAGMRAEGVMGALGQASNMDAALGLAEDSSRPRHTRLSARRTSRGCDRATRSWWPTPGGGWCWISPLPSPSAHRSPRSPC